MRNSAKLGLTALIAALLLASAVTTASAGRISSSTTGIRTTWSRLEFVSTVTVRCKVTLEGSLHSRTIAKRERALIGAVTRFDVNACTNGTASPLRLPWHITYESFEGTLPNITALGILIQRFQIGFIINFLGSRTCLYGNERDNISLDLEINAERLAGNLIPVSGLNIAHLLEGTVGCPTEGRLVGAVTDGATVVLGSGAQIKITLI